MIHVPEAEPWVGALRDRFDASVELGVPAHITVLVPFMPPQRITGAVLQRAQSALGAVPSFTFRLSKVQRFPATTYLAPEPPEPFIELTRRLVRSFPEYPPFGGQFESIVPHLTVSHGSTPEAEIAAAELAAVMQARGPIASTARTVSLLENSSGMWREMHAFSLSSPRRGAA